MISVGIVGATGYTGLELCRLLSQHNGVTISHVYANQNSGQSVSQVYPHLSHISHLSYETFDPGSLSADLDVLFLATPHATSHQMMSALLAQSSVKIVDLSADFRLDSAELFETVYDVKHAFPEILSTMVQGFPELYRDEIRDARVVAAPGCYSTAVILGAKPLANAGFSGFIADAKSGVTGAGKAPKSGSMYCETDESIGAYGTGAHRHEHEMRRHLGVPILFSPHLVPMKRGILASIYVDNPDGVSQEDVSALYDDMYADEPFVVLAHDMAMPATKYVAGSNRCMISVKVLEEAGKIVVFSVIDNLIKGASGQAIQCMNLMMGLEETAALTAEAMYL